MKIAIFLENTLTGGCIATTEIEVADDADEFDVSNAIHDATEVWVVGINQRICIEPAS